MFFWCWDGESVGRLLEYILPVYSGDPSIAELIIVNASLFRLFSEVANAETRPEVIADLVTQGKVCQKNLDIILSRLPFNLASNFDNLLALFHAVSIGLWLVQRRRADYLSGRIPPGPVQDHGCLEIHRRLHSDVPNPRLPPRYRPRPRNRRTAQPSRPPRLDHHHHG